MSWNADLSGTNPEKMLINDNSFYETILSFKVDKFWKLNFSIAGEHTIGFVDSSIKCNVASKWLSMSLKRLNYKFWDMRKTITLSNGEMKHFEYHLVQTHILLCNNIFPVTFIVLPEYMEEKTYFGGLFLQDLLESSRILPEATWIETDGPYQIYRYFTEMDFLTLTNAMSRVPTVNQTNDMERYLVNYSPQFIPSAANRMSGQIFPPHGNHYFSSGEFIPHTPQMFSVFPQMSNAPMIQNSFVYNPLRAASTVGYLPRHNTLKRKREETDTTQAKLMKKN